MLLYKLLHEPLLVKRFKLPRVDSTKALSKVFSVKWFERVNGLLFTQTQEDAAIVTNQEIIVYASAQ